MSNCSGIKHHGGNGDASEYVKKAIPQKIIEWYSVEPNLQLMTYFCCSKARPLMIMPCFWPHLLILSPCFCCSSYNQKIAALHSTVVLTETTVNLVQEPFTVCGCCPIGGTSSSIQIFQISDVIIKEN